MFGRRLFHFIFMIVLLLAYALVYLYLLPMDAIQYVSLLYSTIALFLVFNIPVTYPKKGHSYAKVTFKLYLITIIYAAIVFTVSYLFSFKYTLDPRQSFLGMPLDVNFYFLAHLIGLGIALFLILIGMAGEKSTKEKVPFYDDEEVVEEVDESSNI